MLETVNRLDGVVRSSIVADGMMRLLTIHVRPGAQSAAVFTALFDPAHIESVQERDPTLEEAYLTLLS